MDSKFIGERRFSVFSRYQNFENRFGRKFLRSISKKFEIFLKIVEIGKFQKSWISIENFRFFDFRKFIIEILLFEIFRFRKFSITIFEKFRSWFLKYLFDRKFLMKIDIFFYKPLQIFTENPFLWYRTYRNAIPGR